MALAHVASSTIFLLNVSAAKSARPQVPSHLPSLHTASWVVPSFKSGIALVVKLRERNFECRSMWVPIKCEQGTKETGGLDVWLGRLAMVGFASAITVEVVTGKGLLEV
ncbi:hypothetical protein KSP39_PZI023320 [Platanthera zijinensis]|uniref:Uncharacterized protein n=1 Tax=Platanthera zijinensis TaxID=2320716 RepID=A0AAP0FV42_9ASPA